MPKKVTLNQIGVMIEDVRDRVNALGEGQKILEGKIVGVEKSLGERINGVEQRLYSIEQRLDKKIDNVHSSLKNEIHATFHALNDKLDEHIRQPAHA